MLYDVLKLYFGKFQLHTPVTPIQTSWAQRTVSDFTPKVGGENAAQYLPQCKIDYSYTVYSSRCSLKHHFTTFHSSYLNLITKIKT